MTAGQMCKVWDCDGVVDAVGWCVLCGVYQPHPKINEHGQLIWNGPDGKPRFAGDGNGLIGASNPPKDEVQMLWDKISLVSDENNELIQLVSSLQIDLEEAMVNMGKLTKLCETLTAHVIEVDTRTAWMRDPETGQPYPKAFEKIDESMIARFYNLDLE